MSKNKKINHEERLIKILQDLRVEARDLENYTELRYKKEQIRKFER